MSLGVPREILIEKNKDFFELVGQNKQIHTKISFSTQKSISNYYLQLTDHANVPWAVDIIIFMHGFPETWKLFQGFLQGKKIEKGWYRLCWEMKMTAFWDIAPYSLVEEDRRFRGTYCLHYQDDGDIPQKASYSPLWEPEISLMLI
jgi:hypothetical protein